MARGYRILGVAVAVMLLLAGLVKLTERNQTADDAAAGSATATTANLAVPPVLPAAVSTTDPLTGAAEVAVDVADGDVAPTDLPPIPAADCTITEALKNGSAGDAVNCLATQLTKAGFAVAAGSKFDDETDAAVRAFQSARGLYVDGVVGRRTAEALGIWAGPDGPLQAVNADCPGDGRSAVVDRANQRVWLCDNGALVDEFKMTSAWSQPDPGSYEVYAKDLNASSTISGTYSTMTHFVAFTRGKYQGARIAFHSMPKDSNGNYLQPLDSLGTAEAHGQSAGCIRVHPDTAAKIWDWLDIGDSVRVIS
jgi:peptidoglycan hydrolase-like protein with peptidoglycan-binding domain